MQLRWKLLIQSVTVILGAALFLFMIGLLSVDNWEYFSTEVYYNLNQIVRRQVWSLIACYSLLLPIPALIDAVIENIKAGKHLWCFIWIFISLVLVLFSGRFFGYQVFAFTSAVYGGGVGVEVHFAADAKCVDTLKGCGVTFSVDPTVSDKVWLIWETEHALIVVVHYGTKALPDANSPALAMAVRKPDLFRSIEVW